MKKSIFEQLGGTYHQDGDYLVPNIALFMEENRSIGVWGKRHLNYIKQHRRTLYTGLFASGKLNSYLADVNDEAEEMFSQLLKQMAVAEDVTERVKADDQMEWIGKMNNIRRHTREIVNSELIYR